MGGTIMERELSVQNKKLIEQGEVMGLPPLQTKPSSADWLQTFSQQTSLEDNSHDSEPVWIIRGP